MGGSWMVGALDAIAAETGWDPGTAADVIGTSAGAMVAGLLGTGMTPSQMREDLLSGVADPVAKGARTRDPGGASYRIHWSFPRPLLGSPGLALRSLREPWRYGPAGIVAWLPQGVISTEPLKDLIRRRLPVGWSPHPGLWVVATDYRSGDRVVFGREGARSAHLADAVAASCAIPGFYHPVTIGGRRYVDGGLRSQSNLDLAAATSADLVICLNPMSSEYRGHGLGPTSRIAALIRGTVGERLAMEADEVRRAGKRVELLEPNADDVAAMGFNFMSTAHRAEVLETAMRTTAAAIRSSGLARVLGGLAEDQGDQAARAGA